MQTTADKGYADAVLGDWRRVYDEQGEDGLKKIGFGGTILENLVAIRAKEKAGDVRKRTATEVSEVVAWPPKECTTCGASLSEAGGYSTDSKKDGGFCSEECLTTYRERNKPSNQPPASPLAEEIEHVEPVEGKAYPTIDEPVEPGLCVQLTCIPGPPEGSRIVGLEFDRGELQVEKVLLGKRWLTLEECQGQVTGNGFLMALVKNITDRPVIARAAWYVEEPNGAPRKPGEVVGHAPPVTTLPLPPGAVQGVVPAPTPAAPAAATTVTPGTNEVAVLLLRSEAERLIEWIMGTQPMTEPEKPSLVRRLRSGLDRR